MAIMYPKNIELYNATKSEKAVFKALEKQLPDTFTVFYSIQWIDEENGIKKESECDFLIFNEQEGFLTCEVKGGSELRFEDGKFILADADGERVLKRSPMQQADESYRYFFNLYMEEYNERFNGTHGSICIFPYYLVNDPVLMDHRTKDTVLDKNDMNDLEKRIKNAFRFCNRRHNTDGRLTKSQKTNFKEMITKRIASKASASSIIEEKEYELEIVNRVQDNLIYFLKNYCRTFISGGAGTGKSWIAYKFAKRALQDGKEVLLTMHSKHLAAFFKTILEGYRNVTIFTFEELIEKDGADVGLCSSVLADKYDNLVFKKYDTIIVDEAQDFDQYQAMIVSMHLKDNNSEFRVFYDLTQNIFDKDFKDGFDIQLPPFILKENLRNTSNIYEWATAETNVGKDITTNQIIGPSPISIVFRKDYELFKYLEDEIVKLVDTEKVSLSSIVLLCDQDNYFKYANKPLGRWKCVNENGADAIKMCLVEDFKGLESNIVFYIHNITTPEKYNYVAFTRAKYILYNLVNKGN